MPVEAIRFTVGTAGHRAETWKVWTNIGAADKSFYLACRTWSVPLKVSFHPSGCCHIRFDDSFVDRHTHPDSRLRKDSEIDQWYLDWASGEQIVFRVAVPHGVVSIERSNDDPADLFVVPGPQDGDVAEVFLSHTAPDIEPKLPPSAPDRPQGHVGTLKLKDGNKVSIDYRHRRFSIPPEQSGSMEMVTGDRAAVLRPGARGVFSIGTPDGPAFLEAVLGQIVQS